MLSKIGNKFVHQADGTFEKIYKEDVPLFQKFYGKI